MDPNATLKMIGELDPDVCLDDTVEDAYSDLCEELHSWLDRGGFEPDWEADVVATKAYLNWRDWYRKANEADDDDTELLDRLTDWYKKTMPSQEGDLATMVNKYIKRREDQHRL